MHRFKSLLFFTTFLALLGGSAALPQTQPDRAYLLVAPIKGDCPHQHLLKGLQQVLIEELRRIIAQPVTDRELISQFLREQGTKGEPFTIYHSDIPDLTEHLNAEKALLLAFDEKYGNVTTLISVVDGTSGNTLKKEETKGVLGAFPKLEKNIVDAILAGLGFLGDPQVQKKSAEGPQCLLGAIAYFGAGLDFIERRQLETAASYFSRAIALDPTLSAAQGQLNRVLKKAEEEFVEPAEIGSVCLKGGDSAKAKAYFSEALKQNLTDIKALIGMGQISLDENNLARASQNLHEVLQLDRNNGEALTLLARVYKAQNNYPQAISLIERAESVPLQKLSFALAAGEVYEAAQRKEKATYYYAQAAELFRKELDSLNCLKYVQKVRELAPEGAASFVIEGDLRISLGDYQGAITSFVKARDLAPDNDEAFQKLALAYALTGDNQMALQGFEKALTLNPQNVNAHIGLADVNQQEKRYEEAVKHYAEAKRLSPQNEEVTMKLADAYTVTNRSDLAIAELNELLSTGPKAGSTITLLRAHSLMAKNLGRLGDFKQARVHLKKSIEIDPDNVSAYEALGMVEKSLGETEAAEKALSIAKSLDPKLTAAQSPPLGDIKEVPEVNSDLEQVLDTAPIDPPNQVALIGINRDIMKPNWFSRFRSHLWFTREDLNVLHGDFSTAMATKYTLVAPATIGKTLEQKLFNSMKAKDIDDDSYMERLCEALDAEGVFFYRVEKIDPPEGGKNLELYVLLFFRDKNRWKNSVTIHYPNGSISKINFPFIILLLLLISGGIGYGFVYFRQGFATLQVTIARDQKAAAYFSVKVSKSPNVDLTRMKTSLRAGIEGKRYSRKARFGSKTEKSMVEKECIFEKLHVGHYFVYLYGVILDADGKQQVGNYQLTKEVDLESGMPAQVTFDLMPKTAYVGVQVRDGGNPAIGAEVSVKGKSGAKYIKDEQGIFFDLEPGQYSLLINFNNRKFLKKITISSIDTYAFDINLSGRLK